MGKVLIITGICLVAAGILYNYNFLGKFPFPGHLPGDLTVKKGNTTIYFPLATGIVISIMATLIVNVIMKMLR